VLVSAHACVRALYRDREKAGLGSLRWRDHDGGHGECTPASEADVGPHRGIGVARMAVRWRGVVVESPCSVGRATTPV
jgi:hypothetical protein